MSHQEQIALLRDALDQCEYVLSRIVRDFQLSSGKLIACAETEALIAVRNALEATKPTQS